MVSRPLSASVFAPAALAWQGGGAWEAAGHRIGTAWIELVGRFGATALLLFFAALLVRAFLRRHRYRAEDVLGPDDLARLHTDLIAAEERTTGEIVPVIVERSDRHPAASWLAAVSFVLVGCALLATRLPWDRPALLILAQAALGAAGFLATRALPDFQRLFVREARATEMAEEQAFQEFHRYGLHRTRGKTGVLLFVSLLERRVVVLADEGIAARVAAEAWSRADAAILGGVARGSLADGLAEGIGVVAEVLAEHFPREEGDRNELPDRIVVRRE